jgi:hypothetical protein
MKELELKEINGNEIIDFLNKASMNNKNLTHISMSSNSFVFENQKIEDDSYKLYFTASYNRWGTDQEIKKNQIIINKKGIAVYVGEPFEGDGTDEKIENVLNEWLETHKFDTMIEERFYALLHDAYEQLPSISFESKEGLQKIIDTLVKAQTFIK